MTHFSRWLIPAVILALLVPISLSATGSKESSESAGPVELVVLSHQVHQDVMTGGPDMGKNLLEEFVDTHDGVSSVRFITAGTPQVRDRLFREASLSETDIDVGFAYSPWLSPDITNFFTGLSSFIEETPLDAPEDVIQSFWEPLTIDGERYGVPMRAGGQSFLFYNRQILEERGVEPPETLEELVAAIKATSFSREDGERVYGYAKQATETEIAFSMGVFVRAMGGDYISPQFESQLTGPEVLRSIRIYKDLYDSGAMPDNVMSLSNADVVSLFQNNRLAFVTFPPNYLNRLGQPGVVESEDIGYGNIPPLERDLDRWDGAAPTATFQWAMTIPKGSQHKQQAWEFIQFMSTRDAVLNMALSGNGPVRQSTFENPRYQEQIPYLDGQLTMFQLGRPMFPAFDRFPQARDTIGEAIQSVLLGQQTPEDAMSAAESDILPMLP